MLIGRLKTYLLLILSGLLTVAAFLLKLSGSRSRRLKRQAENAKARARHAEDVMRNDIEVDLEYDQRTKELKDEVEKRRTSSELSDPNDW